MRQGNTLHELFKLLQHYPPGIGYSQHEKLYRSGKRNVRNAGSENQGLAHKLWHLYFRGLKRSHRAFTRSAVDLTGPFVTFQGPGKRYEKRYLYHSSIQPHERYIYRWQTDWTRMRCVMPSTEWLAKGFFQNSFIRQRQTLRAGMSSSGHWYQIYVIMEKTDVNDEELKTAMIGLAGLINYRPISKSIRRCSIDSELFFSGQRTQIFS